MLCANNLGSCYGSSGPLDVGWPDRIGASRPGTRPGRCRSLLDVLGIEQLWLPTGGSLGGMIVLCLAVLRPGGRGAAPPHRRRESREHLGGRVEPRRPAILRLDPGWPPTSAGASSSRANWRC